VSSAKIITLLDGVPRLIRQIQLADTATRARTIAAIERGTKRVAAGARARAPKLTGEMASTIRDEYSKDKLIGYVKVGFGKLLRRSKASTEARKQRLAKRRKAKGSRSGKGAYAPVVERGDQRRHRKPQPFVMPAFQSEQQSIIAEIGRATTEGARSGGLA
jgi:HK97 gp10 family phage protein